MACPPCSQCTEASEYQQAYILKFQVLDLFAALIINEFEKNQLAHLFDRFSETRPRIMTDAIQLILDETQAAAQGVFERFISSSHACQAVSGCHRYAIVIDNIQG